MLVFLKMMKSLPAGSKEINDSDDKLLFAEILSPFSNFYQVAVDQVPVTVQCMLLQLLLVNWSSITSRWLLVISRLSFEIFFSFSNFWSIGHWSSVIGQ